MADPKSSFPPTNSNAAATASAGSTILEGANKVMYACSKCDSKDRCGASPEDASNWDHATNCKTCEHKKGWHKPTAAASGVAGSFEIFVPSDGESLTKPAADRHELLLKSNLVLNDLSNPQLIHTIPYPAVGNAPSDRYPNRHQFQFIGRPVLRAVHDFVVETIRDSPTNPESFFIYGTVGIGKSYLLSALAAYLHSFFATQQPAKGSASAALPALRVCYLPNCAELILDSVRYIRNALLLTFADDRLVQSKVAAISTRQQLDSFVHSIRCTLLFIADQYNELQHREPNNASGAAATTATASAKDSPNRQLKTDARQLLGSFAGSQYFIFAASANNNTAAYLSHKHLPHRLIFLHGGFSEAEYATWKRVYSSRFPVMSPKQEEQLLFATGRVPYLLAEFLVPPSLKQTITPSVSAADVKSAPATDDIKSAEMFDAAWSRLVDCEPVERIRTTLIDFTALKVPLRESNRLIFDDHIAAVTGCLLRQKLPNATAAHYDHCYSEVFPAVRLNHLAFPPIPTLDVRHGFMTCGFASQAAAQALRRVDQQSLFLQPGWLRAIRENRNDSVRGFQIEEAVLSAIGADGLMLDGQPVKPQRTVYFNRGDEAISAQKDVSTVLHIPNEWNYGAVDCVLRVMTAATANERSFHIAAVQCTAGSPKHHIASIDKFFERSRGWLPDSGSDYKVRWTFVWVTRVGYVTAPVVHPKTKDRPAFSEICIHFGELNSHLGRAVEDAYGSKSDVPLVNEYEKVVSHVRRASPDTKHDAKDSFWSAVTVENLKVHLNTLGVTTGRSKLTKPELIESVVLAIHKSITLAAAATTTAASIVTSKV